MSHLFEVFNKYSLKTNWPVFVGLLFLYLPVYCKLFDDMNNEGQGYAPIILAMILFLFWEKREKLLLHYQSTNLSTHPIWGGLIFIFGLLLYVVGRSQEVNAFSIGSQLPILLGILIIVCDLSILSIVWFPLFFTLFMIPIPGSVMDIITLPMKSAVSYVTEHILFEFGYPISRMGVTLQIGPYKLLVADACAGMHTLISLEAMGLFYINLIKQDSVFRNSVLALLIVPISFVANVTRVMILVLITYYFGDAAGQSFVHKFAGMALFLAGLILIISVDSALQYITYHRSNSNKKKGI